MELCHEKYNSSEFLTIQTGDVGEGQESTTKEQIFKTISVLFQMELQLSKPNVLMPMDCERTPKRRTQLPGRGRQCGIIVSKIHHSYLLPAST